jgi:hypothetical protein
LTYRADTGTDELDGTMRVVDTIWSVVKVVKDVRVCPSVVKTDVDVVTRGIVVMVVISANGMV